jgi:aminoglycoside 6'-N-acetyltransferase
MDGAVREDDVELKVLDPEADLPLVERWLCSPHVVRWWGAQDLYAGMLARRSRETDAVITADRKAIGYLCWQTLSPSELETAGLADLPEDLVDIDILIGEPAFLGRGLGPRALVLLLAKLRAAGVGFAGVGTSTSNRAAIRAFEKAGFRPFKDFEDSEFGPCKYMVADLRGAVELPDPEAGASRRG